MRVILLIFTKLIILGRMDVKNLLRLKMYHWLENIYLLLDIMLIYLVQIIRMKVME